LKKIEEEHENTSNSSSVFSRQELPSLQVDEPSESDDYYGLEDLANMFEDEYIGKIKKEVDNQQKLI